MLLTGNRGKYLMYGGVGAGVALVGYGAYTLLKGTTQSTINNCANEYATWQQEWLTLYAGYIKQNPSGLTTAQQTELNQIQQNMVTAEQCMVQAAANDPNSVSRIISSVLDSNLAVMLGAIVVAGIIAPTAATRIINAYRAWRTTSSGQAFTDAASTSESIQASGQAMLQGLFEDNVIDATTLTSLSTDLTTLAAVNGATEESILDGFIESLLTEAIITEDVAATLTDIVATATSEEAISAIADAIIVA